MDSVVLMLDRKWKGRLKNDAKFEKLKKYGVDTKELNIVIEEQKQRLFAKNEKLTRFE